LGSSGITGAAASGANSDITSLSGLTSAVAEVRQIQPISASISANAITISASALALEFRSATLTTGVPSFVEGTPANLVIAATDSFALITAAGKQRIAILAINNAGTVELAASAIYGGVALDETGVITTVTAATTATQIKSTAVRTSVAYRVVGFVDATFTTAVGWGSLALVQGAGGNAATAFGSLGYGQRWTDVTGSRAFGTTYYNTTGKPIEVTAVCNNASISGYAGIVNGQQMWLSTHLASTAIQLAARCLVPAGQSYQITFSAGTPLNLTWTELR
jgi:hypothetical protein